MSPAKFLGRDVLMEVFDLVELSTLLTCTRVSGLWRLASRYHPTFWKTLTICGDGLTAGMVSLFLDRLESNPGSESVISLSIQCTTESHLMDSVVLPAITRHIHRCEELAFVASPRFARLLWPTFTITVPRLRSLQVIIRKATPDLEPIPAMFGVHAYSTLQHIFLLDVPLSADIPPIQHPVKAVKVTYLHQHPRFDHVLRLIPRPESLDLWSGQSGDSAAELDQLMDRMLLDDLKHLVVYDDEVLKLRRCRDVPVLDLRMRKPEGCNLRSTLPDRGPLCMRMDVMPHPMIEGRRRGLVTVTTADGRTVRHFDLLSTRYLRTRAFMGKTVLADRLVELAVGLASGFVPLCRYGYRFPRLQTLGIAIKRLHTDRVLWKNGAIECPSLRNLVFRGEHGVGDVLISRTAVDRFISDALATLTSAPLNLVLRNVQMTGETGPGALVSSVTYRPYERKACWYEQARQAGRSGPVINKIGVLTQKSWEGWMDV